METLKHHHSPSGQKPERVKGDILNTSSIYLILIIGGINVPLLHSVASFGTDYFLLKIKILAKCKRELITKRAIS